MKKLLVEFCAYLELKGYCKFVDSDPVINDFLKSLQYQGKLKNTNFDSKSLDYPFEGNINISFFALEKIISSSVELGIENYLIYKGEKSDFMTQAAAYRKYGRSTIDRWYFDGKIEKVMQNGRYKYKISDLERLSTTYELFRKFL